MLQERFSFLIAGDSGDGIQVLGQNFSASHALFGHSVKTVSFFPAEIRAPAGTTHGVSGYQVCFSQKDVWAPSAKVEFLIALNPAAYWVSKDKLAPQGHLICDSELWAEKNWKKAGLDFVSPDSIEQKVTKVPLTQVTLTACQDYSLTFSQAKKNRNFTALGLTLWLSDLPMTYAFNWLEDKFALKDDILQTAKACVQAGYNLGETLEIEQCVLRENLPSQGDKKRQSQVVENSAAVMAQRSQYSLVTGNQAISLACVAMAQRTGKKVFLYGYPITPASDILEYSKKWPQAIDVTQAEDEMAALGMSLGAAWGGHLSLTCTSGPGFDLKAELMGLGASAELPCVIVNVQRSGPSTGMPTKVEQSDLLAALWGRHGDCPLPVLTPYSAESCVDIVQKAFLWAIKAQCPVIVLSDLALAQSSGQVNLDNVELSPVSLPDPGDEIDNSQLFKRNEHYAKPWVIPGNLGGQSCIGGLEKDVHTGLISYDGDNHQQMVQLRQSKVDSLAEICPLAPSAHSTNETLIISFGSSAMVIKQWLVDNNHLKMDAWSLTDMMPLPANFQEVLSRYKVVIVVEMNHGQLIKYLKMQTLSQSVQWVSWCWQKSALFDDLWLNSQLKLLQTRENIDA